MLVSLFGALNFGGGDLFPGGSFGNVTVMSLSLAERKEEVSVLRESEEGEDVEESNVVEGGLDEGGEPWLPWGLLQGEE